MLNDCNVYVVHMHQPTISQSHPMCIFLFVGEFHPFIHLKYYYFFLSTILPLALREEVIVSHSTWLYQGRTLIFAFTLQHEYSIWWMPSWSVWLFSPFSFHLCTKLMVTIWLFSFEWFCWSFPLVNSQVLRFFHHLFSQPLIQHGHVAPPAPPVKPASGTAQTQGKARDACCRYSSIWRTVNLTAAISELAKMTKTMLRACGWKN